MKFEHLQAGIGYVTRENIFDRFKFRTPPAGESYRIQLIEGRPFAVVGSVCYGEMHKLFEIYAGNEELYLHLCDQIAEAAEQLGYPLEAEEWQ